jgi:DNA-binding transcriptional ArsR family regulator
MTTVDSTTVLGWLKAAGEESRLRLLALCARQELSVSDLAEALRQSEPRVSRHLRILCEAGLLERLRQGQWVHYRVTRDAAAAAFVQGVLGQVERGDPVFANPDRELARPTATTVESRLGRALKGFVEAVDFAVGGATTPGGVASAGDVAGSAGDRAKAALVVGVEHLELLETAAAVAGECVAIAHSRRAAQSARAFAERRGIACRVLLASGSNVLSDKDIEVAGAPFDVVFLDHLAVPDSALDGLLAYGRRALAAGGRLWLFERYEALAHGASGLGISRDKAVEHPIGRLRRLLGDVGLTCERLSPIEADGEHVLAAVAVPTRAVLRGVSAA